MCEVVDVAELKLEDSDVIWVEVMFSHLNARYVFRQKGPTAEPKFAFSFKPESVGRSSAPKLQKGTKKSMYRVTAAICRGRYEKRGLLPPPAPKQPETKTAELFQNQPPNTPRPKRTHHERFVRHTPFFQQPRLAFPR